MGIYRRILRINVALAGVAAWTMVGCGPANNGLPETVTIDLPDGTTQVTTLGSGVISFADSRWEFFQTGSATQSIPFVTIVFGDQGQLEAFENNTIAANIFGTTILFDGERHPAAQPGLTYAAATFGAETSDSQGFAFEGRFTGFAAGLEAATGSSTASGTFDADDINTVRGTFEFTSRVTLLNIPEGNVDMSINYVGRRVE